MFHHLPRVPTGGHRARGDTPDPSCSHRNQRRCAECLSQQPGVRVLPRPWGVLIQISKSRKAQEKQKSSQSQCFSFGPAWTPLSEPGSCSVRPRNLPFCMNLSCEGLVVSWAADLCQHGTGHRLQTQARFTAWS
jgi:hypothetical protein